MDTKNVFGWVLPAGEAHLDTYLPTAPVLGGRSVYQFHQIREALLRAPSRKVAVDVGGHVGFWSYYLAREFQHVYAFEPSAPLIECFRRNVTQPNVYLHEVALGEAPGRVGLAFIEGHSMMAHVTEAADGTVERTRLDDLELLSPVKIDVEGYEPYRAARCAGDPPAMPSAGRRGTGGLGHPLRAAARGVEAYPGVVRRYPRGARRGRPALPPAFGQRLTPRHFVQQPGVTPGTC
jgi:FkbM family methyltransferase